MTREEIKKLKKKYLMKLQNFQMDQWHFVNMSNMTITMSNMTITMLMGGMQLVKNDKK